MLKHLTHRRVGLGQWAIGNRLQGNLLQRECAGVGQRADPCVPLLHGPAYWAAAPPLLIGAREATEPLVSVAGPTTGCTAGSLSVALQRAVATIAASLESATATDTRRLSRKPSSSAIATSDRAILARAWLAQRRGVDASGVTAAGRLTGDELTAASRAALVRAIHPHLAGPDCECRSAAATGALNAAPLADLPTVHGAIAVASRMGRPSPFERRVTDGTHQRRVLLQPGTPDGTERVGHAAATAAPVCDEFAAARAGAHNGRLRYYLGLIGVGPAAVLALAVSQLRRGDIEDRATAQQLADRWRARPGREAEVLSAAVLRAGLLRPRAAIRTEWARLRVALRHKLILGQVVKKNTQVIRRTTHTRTT